MLFWTELKPMFFLFFLWNSFRAVLFWTELKLCNSMLLTEGCFRVVLFWTELNRNLTIMSYIMFYKV